MLYVLDADTAFLTLVDRHSRKRIILIFTLLNIVAGLMTALTSDYELMLTDIEKSVRIAAAAMAASSNLDADRFPLYLDLVLNSLTEAARARIADVYTSPAL